MLKLPLSGFKPINRDRAAREPQQLYDLTIPNDDFKVITITERDRANFESADIQTYLGTGCRSSRCTEVGVTIDDLRSRLYSSTNPNYFLLCAFQCCRNTTKEELELIESSALNYLDSMFIQENDLMKRVRHFESQHLSECYYDISFDDSFVLLHDYLREHQYRYFQTAKYACDATRVYGDALSCEFNPRLTVDQQSHFLRLIVRQQSTIPDSACNEVMNRHS